MGQSIYAGQMLSAQDPSTAKRVALDVAAAELGDMNVLFGLYKGRIYRYALLSLRDPELAESLTHDCLMRAHNARTQFRGDCSVATWLTRIATNLIRDHVRSRKLQFWKAATASAVDPADVVNRLRSHEPTPEASLLQREQVKVLWQRVEKLSSKQRSVFLLRFVEELELSEIAAAMEMNISTVKSHLHRALQAVRAAMEKKQYVLSRKNDGETNMSWTHMSTWEQEEYAPRPAHSANDAALTRMRCLPGRALSTWSRESRSSATPPWNGARTAWKTGLQPGAAVRPMPAFSKAMPALRWAAAAALLLLVLIPLSFLLIHKDTVTATSAQVKSPTVTAPLGDDALLQEVDDQVSEAVPDSMESLTHLVSTKSGASETADQQGGQHVQTN